MKKVVVYFSDIMGTIFGKNENSFEHYQMFNQLLETIKDLEGADEIIFSLVSADKQDTIEVTQHAIASFISNTVVFGKQFFENGYYQDRQPIQFGSPLGKTFQIVNYVNEISQTNDVVAVYYADDATMNQQMLNTFAEKYNWETKLTSIIPKQHTGIAETNYTLKECIDSKFGKSRQRNKEVRI